MTMTIREAFAIKHLHELISGRPENLPYRPKDAELYLGDVTLGTAMRFKGAEKAYERPRTLVEKINVAHKIADWYASKKFNALDEAAKERLKEISPSEITEMEKAYNEAIRKAHNTEVAS